MEPFKKIAKGYGLTYGVRIIADEEGVKYFKIFLSLFGFWCVIIYRGVILL